MKKLYLLAATAIVGFTLAQNRPSDAQMAPIFAKMNAVSNPAAPEPHGFFTEEEGNLIRAYYAHDAVLLQFPQRLLPTTMRTSWMHGALRVRMVIFLIWDRIHLL